MTSAAVIPDTLPRASGEAPLRRSSLREFVEASGLQSLVLGISKDPNAKITVLLVSPQSGEPVFAVKAPTTDPAALAVEAERHLLVDLRGLLPERVLQTIPRVLDVVEFDGRPAAVMTAVHGIPMTTRYFRWRHTAGPARVAADFAAIETWLAELQRGTVQQIAPMDMDGGVAARLRSRFPEDEHLGTDLDRLSEIYARLRRNAVPRTAIHGDLWFGNVFVAGGQASGVVDWESGATSGEPMRDLVRFALMYALYLDRRTREGHRVAGHPGLRADRWGAGVEYALDGSGWFPGLFRRFLGDALSRLGASPASWRDAALAGIAEVAALTDDREFGRLHLELFRRLGSPEPSRKDVP